MKVFEDKLKEIDTIQIKLVNEYMKNIDNKLNEIFEPYILNVGVKKPFTKNKLKWWGIKVIVYKYDNLYQLSQRGEFISPKVKIDFVL